MLTILNSVLSIILTAISGYLVWWLQQNKNKKDYTQEALKILLFIELKKEYLVYMEKGFVTIDELQGSINIYTTYHNLKGNGTGTKMIEEIKKLPLKEDD